jgi:hypothetical protein
LLAVPEKRDIGRIAWIHPDSSDLMTARDTLRQAIISSLESAQGPVSFRDLSVELGVSEKDLPAHMEHVAKTLRSQGRRLIIIPASCRACGHEFGKRTRMTRPSRCPMCKSERIEPQLFTLGDHQ